MALASWDLFLDPMMVAAGYWTWDNPSRELPGIEGIPANNFAGWLLTSLVMIGLLDLLGRAVGPMTPQPIALWLWTWIGGIVANLFFLDRPSVALVGGIAMGLVGVPAAVAAVGGPRLMRAITAGRALVAAGSAAAAVLTAHTACNLRALRTPPDDPPPPAASG